MFPACTWPVFIIYKHFNRYDDQMKHTIHSPTYQEKILYLTKILIPIYNKLFYIKHLLKSCTNLQYLAAIFYHIWYKENAPLIRYTVFLQYMSLWTTLHSQQDKNKNCVCPYSPFRQILIGVMAYKDLLKVFISQKGSFVCTQLYST